MPLKNLEEALLNSNNEINVIFINGAWGSGKTTFVKRTFGEKCYTKPISYVSCFGIDSINQLKSDIATNKRDSTSHK